MINQETRTAPTGEGGATATLRRYWKQIQNWMRPLPSDTHPVQVLKLFYKTLVLLVGLAFSPLILVVLLFVFFAAV